MRTFGIVAIGASMCAVLSGSLVSAHAAETTVGNNLSVPLIWSESAYPPPITIPVTEQFSGEVLPGHVIARDTTSPECLGAVQQDPGNVWQGDTSLVAGNSVTSVDWGDNLESMDPNLSRAYTRVEVGLSHTLETASTGYDMCWISGRGTNEMWGAQVVGPAESRTPVTSERTDALVYTAGARLTIQRIVPDRDYAWNPSAKRWEGTGADSPYFSSALHEAQPDGPGSFGAEVTISGRLTYGYLWNTSAIPTGEYRLTFSLDGVSDSFPGSGTNLATASVLSSAENTMAETEQTVRSEGSGNAAVMRGELNLTYLDVTVGVRTDPVPVDEPTAPTSGPSSSSSSSGPASLIDPPVGPGGPVGLVPIEDFVPVAATGRIPQQATIRAWKKGTYRVGRTLVLAAKPVVTDAGVTVRWRVREADTDRCKIRLSGGRATVVLERPGSCTVIGWAPAPSQDYAPFRWTRTYRIVR